MTIELRAPEHPADLDAARVLLREYRASLTAAVCLQGFDAEVAGLPGAYAAPRGLLLLALRDGEPVGCVALRPLDADRAELKRLYVRPAARGLALGQALVERAVAFARGRGYREVVLDTLPSMRTAQRLYERLGFRDCPRWDGAAPDERRFMALATADGPSSAAPAQPRRGA